MNPELVVKLRCGRRVWFFLYFSIAISIPLVIQFQLQLTLDWKGASDCDLGILHWLAT